jgi:chromosomal replication initiator protein
MDAVLDRACENVETPDVAQIWAEVSIVLKREMGAGAYDSWAARLTVAEVDDTRVVFAAPTAFCRDWLRTNALPRMVALWRGYDPLHRQLSLTVRTAPPAKPGLAAVAAPASAPVPVAARADVKIEKSTDKTFANFIEGPANSFALGVARAVASAETDLPVGLVMLHGSYGNGKSHLLQGIVAAVNARPGGRAVYLTAEQFTQDFVRSVMDKTANSFKADIRSVDVLLIDDIHFVAGKASTQDELLHAMDALLGAGKRVVVAADRPASTLEGLDARLRSRLSGGLACAVGAADRDMRRAILTRKLSDLAVRQPGLNIAPEVLDWLADGVTDSVRALEGALVTLAARSAVQNQRIGLPEAQDALRGFARAEVKRVSVEDIQRKVAEHYRLKMADLLSARRARALARPRQVAMYLCKQLTTRSLPDIGRRFGGRDHTTVLHAVKRIDALMTEDAAMAEDVKRLQAELQA